jgi:HEPN domain-containing protein
MSLEKARGQAARWLQQAKADLKAASSSMEAGSHEWACFQSQQSGEKALKALWYHTCKDPWGHSILKLIQGFPDDDTRSKLASLIADAQHLDKLYITTRYPNGLPDLTPTEVFSEKDAKEAIEAARHIIDVVSALASI